MKKIYISGPITAEKHYRENFRIAQLMLLQRGYAVMSPAILPEGFDYEEYMSVCFAMLDVCKFMALLDGWKNSPGSKREYEYALIRGYEVVKIDELLK